MLICPHINHIKTWANIDLVLATLLLVDLICGFIFSLPWHCLSRSWALLQVRHFFLRDNWIQCVSWVKPWGRSIVYWSVVVYYQCWVRCHTSHRCITQFQTAVSPTHGLFYNHNLKKHILWFYSFITVHSKRYLWKLSNESYKKRKSLLVFCQLWEIYVIWQHPLWGIVWRGQPIQRQ